MASVNAIIEALQGDGDLAELISLSILTLVVTAALWWIYFWAPHHRAISTFTRSLRYGYGHYVVLAAAAAVSVGIGVQIDALTGDAVISETAASLTVAIPIAVFMITVWWVAIREGADRTVNIAVPVGALLVLMDPLMPIPIAITSFVLVILVVILVRHPPLEADAERGHALT